MGKSFFTLLLLCSFMQIRAQVDFSPALWQDIDSLLEKKTALKTLSGRVDELIPAAFKQGNYLAAARCYDYQLRLRDQLTEDSLYFYNSRTADSLLRLPSLPAEFKTALHLQMARRLIWFTRKGLRFNRILYERKDLPVNYAALSNAELLKLARQHFETGEKLAGNLGSIPVSEIIWMSSDPLQFLFRPELYDIIISEQIQLLGNGYSYDNAFSQEGTTVLDYSPDEFISRIRSFTSTDSSKRFVLRLYAEWLEQHRQSPSTYYFIESLARRFCFEQTQLGSNNKDVWLTKYEQYLAGRIQSPYTPVKAYAIYQLCLIWNQQAKKYCPEFSYDYYSYRPNTSREFDTTWRYHGVKALQLFRNNYASLDSFTYLQNILSKMEEQLRQPETEMRLEEYSVPGKPLLGELRFRNTDTLYYRIVQCNYQFRFSYNNQEQYFKEILSLPVVRDNRQVLPVLSDYNRHISYLKLDALPVGFYYIVFSDQPIGAGNKRMKQISFKVSGMAAVENGDRVYVLNRQTGMPVEEAQVNAKFTLKNIKGMDSTVYQLHQTNKAGYTVLKDDRIKEAEIYKNGDTLLMDNVRVRPNDDDEEIYSKDDYENLAEYFEENAEMHIYTDRSIYRPGQTVFYKAIILTRNPETGEPVLMNPANMGRGLFNHTYKKWLKESEPLLYIEDALGKTIDSVYFKPDAFGSISGSFKIPLSAATGEWEISPDYIEKKWDNGSFRVEEYKRPSYEITVEKPVRVFNPGDTLEFNVKLRSFAGAALNNVPVEYTLTANGYIPGCTDKMKLSSFRTLADTTLLTDKDGKLQIRMKDPLFAPPLQLPDTSWRITYTLQAAAYDPSGEVYEKDINLTVSSRPVTITYNGPDKINRSRENKVGFSTRDLNAGIVNRQLKIRVYRYAPVTALKSDRILLPVDTWLYPEKDLVSWFPANNIISPAKKEPVLILQTELKSAAGDFFRLDSALFETGEYKLEAICMVEGKQAGMMEKDVSVFDEMQHRLPDASGEFHQLPFNSFLPGEKIRMFTGFPEDDVYVIREMQYYTAKRKKVVTRVYQEAVQPAGLQTWEWKIPKDASGQLLISQLIIHRNQLYQFKETVYVNDKKEEEPEIIVERYRSRLQPGAQETFAVSIKTKNPKAVAELMTVMYDASLDKLEPHKWEKPVRNRYRNISSDWTYRINEQVKNYSAEVSPLFYESAIFSPGHSTALWWLNPLDYTDLMGAWNKPGRVPNRSAAYDMDSDGVEDALRRLPGMNLASSRGLDEVVVVGYGTSQRKMDLSGSVAGITIRGNSNLTSYAQPLIILDGVVFEGDLSKLDPALITAAMVLKGADASAIYGSRASSGVLILSTKGEIILPGQEPPPPVPPRKNFNETAFFFPSVHADRDGYFSFSFTMPESVTEWNWKMMAHTTKAKFAYAERKLQTQLPLMIQASVPRVFYQGDRLILKHRISNLDTSEVSGQVTCKLEDVVTGEALSSAFRFTGSDRFTLAAKATGYTATEIRVPAGQLNPVRLIVTVRSKQFADGEEHILPVLSKNVFIRQSQSFSFSNADTLITAMPLTADAKRYGTGLSILPKRQSALLNSLPYLAEYPWECAEQLTSKIQALSTAIHIMRTDKEAQQSFERAKKDIGTNGEKKTALPEDFPQASMPWLAIGQQKDKEQAALFRVLDSTRALSSIEGYLDKLYALQQTDKGLSWFSGGESNPWISQYVLGCFGQMNKAGLLNFKKTNEDKFNQFLKSLTAYCDQVYFRSVLKKYPEGGLEFLWSRSYWLKESVPDAAAMAVTDSILKYHWSNADRYAVTWQALLIIVTTKYKSPTDTLYRKAVQLARSIREQAIEDPVNGIRWKAYSNQDELTYSSEESMRILADAFEQTLMQEEVIKGMLQWILSAREEHHWSSTRSTAAVIQLLGKSGQGIQDPTMQIKAGTGNDELIVSNDLLTGSPVAFRNDTTLQKQIRLTKAGEGTARGSLVWYYFTADPQQINGYPGLKIKKQVTRYNSITKAQETVDENTLLKQGEKLTISLVIETDHELRYVLINDRRSSALEPIETSSEYVYGNLSHYRSVRDDGVRLFADYIPAGRHTVSYEVRVAFEGEFCNGMASLQCMYRPDISAYSESMVLKAEGSH